MFLSYVEVFLFLLFVPAIAGALLGIFSHPLAGRVSLALCSISCIAGILAYPVTILSGNVGYTFPLQSAWGSYSILIDTISSMVITVSSAVFLMVVLHTTRSASAPNWSRYYSLMCLLFMACVLAMSADAVLLLLISWEMVTVTTFLMAYNNKGDGARWRFLVITHLGGLMVASAFLIMYSFAGTGTLSEWSGLGSEMGSVFSCVVAALLFMGFGTKLGTLPFHAWKPDLYAEAPTHTSALLSTVSCNVAVLILLKGVFGYLGVGDEMYVIAILLMVLASATAIWGALESLTQTEPKRILAYSSVENMALVTLCLSFAMLCAASGSEDLATIVLIAGLFHSLNHSVFKALTFLTVGTAEDSTGETAIEKMGGLAKVLPLFSFLALVAVLSMAAIPPFNGFASEWIMIQSMMGGNIAGLHGIDLILPLGVAVIGISGMMAAVSYARLYGFMFLGRPRSHAVANPKRIRRLTYAPMIVLAFLCISMGVFAADIMKRLGLAIRDFTSFPFSDEFSGPILGTIDLPVMTFILVSLTAAIFLLLRIRKKNIAKDETWGCGIDLEENMQYSSIGFTQPLVKVFQPRYNKNVDIADEEEGTSKKYSMRGMELFIDHLYDPLGRSILRISMVIGKMQNGNVQTYLGYVLVSLVVLLLVVGLL